jgi:hypothetical protein
MSALIESMAIPSLGPCGRARPRLRVSALLLAAVTIAGCGARAETPAPERRGETRAPSGASGPGGGAAGAARCR